MEERKLTNIEMFLMFVGLACLILAVGYQNIILGGVFAVCGFFVVASIVLRRSKQKKQEEEGDKEFY